MLALTGTAAALLSGLTYHSVLGIRDIDDRCNPGLTTVLLMCIYRVWWQYN